MKAFLLIGSFVFLSACADTILDEKEREVFKHEVSPSQVGSGFSQELLPARGKTLPQAAEMSNKLAAAYFEAAREAQKMQDAASAAVIITAASVASGALKGTSDTALANRGLAAVGLSQAASRGVNRATIESLYDGAQTLNCVGIVASFYQEDTAFKSDSRAADIVIGVIREVRVNTRKGFTRDLADYSAVLTAFRAVIGSDGEEGALETLDLTRSNEAANKATVVQLEKLLTRLGGCVSAKKLSESKETKQG